MNHKNWPSRLFALDVSRGLAALSVVLWHWQHFAYEGHLLSQDFVKANQPLYQILKLFYEKGYMGVEYFFLLSGFIFFWIYRDSIRDKVTGGAKFFIQRFSRLYPLHFITLIIVAILQSIYINNNGESFVYPINDIYHFFLHLGFASNWGFEHSWSFNCTSMVSFYRSFTLCYFFLCSLLPARRFFILSCSFYNIFYSTIILPHPIFMGAALFFLGGSVFHITNLISNEHVATKRLVYLLTMFAWLSVIISFYVYDLSNVILKAGMVGASFLIFFPTYILFPLTVCSLVLFEVDGKVSMKSISWIGDITYSSYLLHFPLQLCFGIAVSYGTISPNFFYSTGYLSSFL